jgi:Gas vesicle protein
MARSRPPGPAGNDWLFPHLATESEVAQSSLLDVIDNVLNHGVVLHGELILGVANVDLIYAKLSVLLAAMDKLREKRGRVPFSERAGERGTRPLFPEK